MADKPRGLLDDWRETTEGVGGLLSDLWEQRQAEWQATDRTPQRPNESFAEYLMRSTPEARRIAEGFAGGPLGGAAAVVRQVGKGVFGPQIAASSWGEAVDALKSMQTKTPGKGEIVGHLQHPDVGDIGVPWGVAGTGKSDGWGLAKLLEYHPEVVDDLPKIIAGTKLALPASRNRARLESPDHTAVVRKTWDDELKRWLLSAFEKKSTPP